METSQAVPVGDGSGRRFRVWLGVVLLAVGLAGHVFAARAITPWVPAWIAYRDHVAGFFLILAVTGATVAALGWRLWRGRRDVMFLVIAALQAIAGIVIYIERFRVIGMH